MEKSWAMKWVKALRSGKYKQGTPGKLKTNDGYCCLGVLCEITNTSRRKDSNGVFRYGKEGQIGVLPINTRDKTNMRRSTGFLPELGTSLATLNDIGADEGRLTFDEIADIIQICYKEL